jgi:hypothetical protein
MRWPQWYPTRADVLGILFVLVVGCIFAFVTIRFPNIQQRNVNAGFGPDWDCTAVPNGEPICVKKQPGNSNTD